MNGQTIFVSWRQIYRHLRVVREKGVRFGGIFLVLLTALAGLTYVSQMQLIHRLSLQPTVEPTQSPRHLAVLVPIS